MSRPGSRIDKLAKKDEDGSAAGAGTGKQQRQKRLTPQQEHVRQRLLEELQRQRVREDQTKNATSLCIVNTRLPLLALKDRPSKSLASCEHVTTIDDSSKVAPIDALFGNGKKRRTMDVTGAKPYFVVVRDRNEGPPIPIKEKRSTNNGVLYLEEVPDDPTSSDFEKQELAMTRAKWVSGFYDVQARSNSVLKSLFECKGMIYVTDASVGDVFIDEKQAMNSFCKRLWLVGLYSLQLVKFVAPPGYDDGEDPPGVPKVPVPYPNNPTTMYEDLVVTIFKWFKDAGQLSFILDLDEDEPLHYRDFKLEISKRLPYFLIQMILKRIIGGSNLRREMEEGGEEDEESESEADTVVDETREMSAKEGWIKHNVDGSEFKRAFDEQVGGLYNRSAPQTYEQLIMLCIWMDQHLCTSHGTAPVCLDPVCRSSNSKKLHTSGSEFGNAILEFMQFVGIRSANDSVAFDVPLASMKPLFGVGESVIGKGEDINDVLNRSGMIGTPEDASEYERDMGKTTWMWGGRTMQHGLVKCFQCDYIDMSNQYMLSSHREICQNVLDMDSAEMRTFPENWNETSNFTRLQHLNGSFTM